MSARLFLETVHIAFRSSSVHVDGIEEKALHKPGLERLQMLLETCRSLAPSGAASAAAFSLESIEKVFENKGWPVDFSLTWSDLTTLIESCKVSQTAVNDEERDAGACAEEDAEEAVRCHMALLGGLVQKRATSQTFPLLQPVGFTAKDEQSAAKQALQLAEKLDVMQVR